MTTAPLTEVRDRLSEIVDDVEAGASAWVITKHGRPVAVILSHEEYESLIETLNVLSDPATMAALAEAEDDLAAGRVTPL
jgi:antitoxin YefM